MGSSTPKRTPDIKKLSIAILEHLVTPVIGEAAKDEIKSPLKEKELREKLAAIFETAETRFVTEHADEELTTALLTMPLSGLESLANAVRDFYERPSDPGLEDVLRKQLASDFPFAPIRIESAVTCFMQILREEFASSGPEDLRDRFKAYAAVKSEAHLSEIAHGVNQLVNNAAAQHANVDENFEQTQAEYFQYLINDLRDHTLRGFAPQVSGKVLSLPLSKIFLPLQAVEGRPALAEYAEEDLRRQAMQETAHETMRELDWRQRLQEAEKRYAQLSARQAAQHPLNLADLLETGRSVLLGDPGSGKTTITRYVTYALAAGDETYTGASVRDLVPVLIRIATYAKAYEKDATLHLVEYVEKELTSNPDFGRFLRRSIEQGNCLIILDGLDEVAERSLRIRVTELIQKMVAAYDQNRFMVTSRIVGYDVSPLTREFTHATLKDLTTKEQEHFVNLWYDAIATEINEGRLSGGAADLVQALKNKPQIARMAANPLLLTIMVLMHWRGVKLPSRRVQVYENATDTLVEYWTAQRNVADLDAEEVKAILKPIAHYVLSSGVGGVITHQDLLPRFHQGIIKERGCNNRDARRIGRRMLQEINEQSGIFLERGIDENDQPVYGFLHQTFGEYLAALHLSELVQSGDFELGNYIHRSIWYEPMLLMAGNLSIYSKPQANQLLRAILDYPAPYEETLQRNVLLAADCLADDISGIQFKLRQEILAKLADLLQHPAPQVQKAAIERYKKLSITRHHRPAAAEIKERYPLNDEKEFQQLSSNISKNIVRALVHVGDVDTAYPLIVKLEAEDRHDHELRRLHLDGWPQQADEYLKTLYTDTNYQFSIQPRLELSECTLGPTDAFHAREILGAERLLNVIDDLIAQERNGDHQAALRWIKALLSEEINLDSLLTMLKDDIPVGIRRLAATKLATANRHPAAIACLQDIAQTNADEASAAAETLLRIGEEAQVDIGLLREMALIPGYQNAAQATNTLFQLQDTRFAILAAIYQLSTISHSQILWESLQALFEHTTAELAFAAARYLALRPGFAYRYQACEAMIEHGRVEEAIPLLEILAYESYGDAGQQACYRLLVLHQTDRIAPLLRHVAQGAEPTQQYQSCLGLALSGETACAEPTPTVSRYGLQPQLVRERNGHYQAGRDRFTQVGLEAIAEIETTDSQKQTAKLLAQMSLQEFGGNPPSAAQIRSLSKLAWPLAKLHAAAYSLVHANITQAHGMLINALQDDGTRLSSPLNSFALEKIQKIISPRTTRELLHALQDEDSSVRYSAARALGRLGDASAVPALLQTLQDEQWIVRYFTAQTLGQLGDASAVPALIQVMQDEQSNARFFAAQTLGQLGDASAVPALIQTLQDEEMLVRNNAAEALGRLGDARAVPALLQALKDEDSSVRTSAAGALGRLGDARAVPALLKALQDEQSNVRYSAARALGRLGDASTVPALLKALQDEQSNVLYSAARALGQLGDASTVPALLQALKDEDSSVRTSAAEALGQLGDASTVPALLQALKDEQSNVRSSAAQALGQLGDASTVPALLQALQDQGWIVRSSAAEALGQLGDASTVPALLQALQDEQSNVRSSAARALGQLGNASAVPALLQALQDQEWIVRSSAARALGQLGDASAVPALLQALQDEDSYVCRNAARALSQLGDASAVPYLSATCATPAHGRALISLDVEAALSTLKQHSEWFPHKDWVFRFYGQALWEAGQLGEAHTNLVAAIEKQSNSVNLLALAHYHLEIESAERAREYLRQIPQEAIDENESMYSISEAVILWLSGEQQSALEAFDKAKQRDKSIVEAQNLRYEHFWREKALGALQEMIEAQT
jgi:HEAT repeat protein